MGDTREDGGGGGHPGRTLALDYGDRRIGLALSDPMGLTARPLMTMTRTTRARDLDRIRAIIGEHDVRRIVVGLPLDMDGGRGARARITEAFIGKIRGATGLPVFHVVLAGKEYGSGSSRDWAAKPPAGDRPGGRRDRPADLPGLPGRPGD